MVVPFYANYEFWLWLLAFLAFWSLVLVYGFGSPWWSTSVGKTLFWMKVSIALVLTHILAVQVFGRYPGSELVRVASVGFVTVMAWCQVVVWRRTQKEARATDCPKRRVTDHQ